MLRLFPILAILAGALGFLMPETLSALKAAIVPALMLVMLCMGLTLKISDFIALKHIKSAFALGISLQFLVMPLLGFSIAKLFGLSPELQVGMILVGSVAGGTASNVMTFLAKGNVALSVAMTTTSTLFSVALTPLWLSILSDQSIAIPVEQIFMSLVNIIVLPIALGLILGRFLEGRVEQLERYFAGVAMLVILIIIAIVVSLNAQSIQSVIHTTGWSLMAAPLLHNLLGLLIGFNAAKLMGFAKAEQRTIALEVGMQNSGIAAALAIKFFSPLTALPAAIFSVWLNVTGAVFARLVTRED